MCEGIIAILIIVNLSLGVLLWLTRHALNEAENQIAGLQKENEQLRDQAQQEHSSEARVTELQQQLAAAKVQAEQLRQTSSTELQKIQHQLSAAGRIIQQLQAEKTQAAQRERALRQRLQQKHQQELAALRLSTTEALIVAEERYQTEAQREIELAQITAAQCSAAAEHARAEMIATQEILLWQLHRLEQQQEATNQNHQFHIGVLNQRLRRGSDKRRRLHDRLLAERDRAHEEMHTETMRLQAIIRRLEDKRHWLYQRLMAAHQATSEVQLQLNAFYSTDDKVQWRGRRDIKKRDWTRVKKARQQERTLARELKKVQRNQELQTKKWGHTFKQLRSERKRATLKLQLMQAHQLEASVTQDREAYLNQLMRS